MQTSPLPLGYGAEFQDTGGVYQKRKTFASAIAFYSKKGIIAFMLEINPLIEKRIFKGEPHYILNWSPLTLADKYKITRSVPSVSGVYEIYKMDGQKKLNLLSITHAWYGGLRSNIRAVIDPLETSNFARKKEPENAVIYYRYSCCDSFKDILDVVWFLHNEYFAGDVRVENSGRYNNFYLTEKTSDKVSWTE